MEFMGRILRHNTAGIVAGLLICTAAPMLMATSNWDDHDRSNRYFSVDSAKNFLSSCPPNAILFTGGDNDTFPLWYAQEVEGYRTDVRVIVLSYFNTDWYIDQMTRQAYQSAPLPISLTHDQYRQGGLNDYLPFVENPNLKGKMVSLKAYLGLLKENYKNIQVETPFGSLNTLPVRSLYLNIDKDDIIARKILPLNILQQVDDQHPARELSNQPVAENSENEVAIPDKMVFTIKNNGIYKNTLITLDIIANSNWSRPVCFSQTALMNLDVDLTPYMVREGNVYQLMPVQRESLQGDLVDTDTMYNNVMNKFVFRELDNPEVYYNEDYRNFVLNHRNTFNALAMGLIREGRMEDARKVLDRSLKVMPDDTVPYDVTTPKTALL
jgi:pentatricopeptide repeat protein